MADVLLQITIWEFLKMQNNVDGLVPPKKRAHLSTGTPFLVTIDISPVLLIHLIIAGILVMDEMKNVQIPFFLDDSLTAICTG